MTPEEAVEVLSHAAFKAAEGSTFAVRGETPTALVLSKVSEARVTPGQEIFGLLLRGPLQPALAQEIHRFEHPAFGEFDMFIVPVAQDAEGRAYEAVFNRLRKA